MRVTGEYRNKHAVKRLAECVAAGHAFTEPEIRTLVGIQVSKSNIRFLREMILLGITSEDAMRDLIESKVRPALRLSVDDVMLSIMEDTKHDMK